MTTSFAPVSPKCRRGCFLQRSLTSVVAVTLLLVMLTGFASSFTTVFSKPPLTSWYSSTGTTSGTARGATIFAPPWEQEEGNVGEESGTAVATSSSSASSSSWSSSDYPNPNHYHHDHLLGTQEEEQELITTLEHGSLDVLARLAAVFAGPEQAVSVRDIQQVHVLEVYQDHLDLEAMLCEHDGCITLAVPVPFPHPCDGGDGDDVSSGADCVLDNLSTLDVTASQTLDRFNWEKEHSEELQAAVRERDALQKSITDSSTTIQYPIWWEHVSYTPEQFELYQECTLLCQLLNEEEEQDALCRLVARPDMTVTHAIVVAIGPAGMIIRANYSSSSASTTYTPQTAAAAATATTTKITTMDTCIPFTPVARTVESLRTAVLAVVEEEGPPTLSSSSSFPSSYSSQGLHP